MMTAATGMTDEDLRLMAVGLANGDVGNASRIVEFVRPADQNEKARADRVAQGDPETRWVGRTPWTENERTYIVLNDKEAIVGRFTRVNNLNLKGAANAMSWGIEAGPGPFWVYAFDPASDLSGFVGQTHGLSFVDDNIAPDTSQPLPKYIPCAASGVAKF